MLRVMSRRALRGGLRAGASSGSVRPAPVAAGRELLELLFGELDLPLGLDSEARVWAESMRTRSAPGSTTSPERGPTSSTTPLACAVTVCTPQDAQDAAPRNRVAHVEHARENGRGGPRVSAPSRRSHDSRGATRDSRRARRRGALRATRAERARGPSPCCRRRVSRAATSGVGGLEARGQRCPGPGPGPGSAWAAPGAW